MTVALVTRVQRFTGLAADTKPTAGVPAGSTFLEVDTGRTYVFDGGTWSAGR
jgi:hypothetical protein